MKKKDKYRHFKGDIYEFHCISLPKEEETTEVKEKMRYVGKVRFHENTHNLDLYKYGSIYLIDSDLPHVIYKNNEIDMSWARPVDEFFGYKEIKAGECTKRFTRIEKDEGEMQ
ncbi:DUF1653 domain-containing protein [Virgibacillus halodenitrificans]|uniref:DUF1653 domain-containing protein n=1 Tax=Virgibacillus halodenitrificans TaxID=1482 RepID=UPI000EF5359C|nr:DUF1653 domain-containing protein [Virgibacillus halodenitrificans]